MAAGTDIEIVESHADLKRLCERLAQAPWLAVDTEFQREKTYFPLVCLIQVATDSAVACIDPLKLTDLSPLLRLLVAPEVTKVFHAGRQDLEIFYQLAGEPLKPVFDTQIAAPLLGFPEQVGYAALVERVLDVRLPKAYTRADWTLRPLPAEQLRYAADDVRYLASLYRIMHERLSERGRLEWLQADFAALSNPSLYEVEPDRAWMRVSGCDRLEGSRLAILQVLAGWRENTARSENIPRGWVLKDENMVDVATMMPTSRAELQRVRGISERALRRYADSILKLVHDGQRLQPQPRVIDKRLRLSQQDEALIDCLHAIVRLCAQQQDLAPAVIATRKDIERLISDEANSALTSGWRAGMVLEELRAFMRGEAALSVEPGRRLSLRCKPLR